MKELRRAKQGRPLNILLPSTPFISGLSLIRMLSLEADEFHASGLGLMEKKQEDGAEAEKVVGKAGLWMVFAEAHFAKRFPAEEGQCVGRSDGPTLSSFSAPKQVFPYMGTCVNL